MHFTDNNLWKNLKTTGTLAELFAHDTDRWNKFNAKFAVPGDDFSILLDYSKQKIDADIFQNLIQLAKDLHLQDKIEAMFRGDKINITENRAVWHTELRNPNTQNTEIKNALKQIEKISTAIRNHSWLGCTGKAITDVVNIGIGGSDLGPKMVTEALFPYQDKISCHFISNIDGSDLVKNLKNLNYETTLFIISSKTFTTLETIENAKAAQAWFLKKGRKEDIAKHFVAVSTNIEKAAAFGIAKDNILPFWDFVGGRFSLWSAIGLSIAITVGFDKFQELLHGAFLMDEHFRHSPLEKNLPVIMGMLEIYNINKLGISSLAVIPYDQYLHLFPSFLQQLEMESNGKSVDLAGNPVPYQTSPIVWGESGTNGQHAFHQLFMQGTAKLAIDFIVPIHSQNEVFDHHELLFSNALAQARALAFGKHEDEFAHDDKLKNHKIIKGNVPSNMLLLKKVDPVTLGALIALYEHKVMVMGTIWNINSFDQFGVELGKKISLQITDVIKNDNQEVFQKLDQSTQNLLTIFRKERNH